MYLHVWYIRDARGAERMRSQATASEFPPADVPADAWVRTYPYPDRDLYRPDDLLAATQDGRRKAVTERAGELAPAML